MTEKKQNKTIANPTAKMEKESKGKQTIELPMTNLIPATGRYLLIAVAMESGKTKTGLILPSSITVKDQHKNNVSVDLLRYFIVSVPQKSSTKLNIGDEVYPLVYDDVTLIKLPRVIDYSQGDYEFLSIHETEIMAYKRNNMNVNSKKKKQ